MKHADAMKLAKRRRQANPGRRPRPIYLATIASGNVPGLADFAPSGQLGVEKGSAGSDTTLVVVHERCGKIISHIYSPVLCSRSTCSTRARIHLHPANHVASPQPRS